MTFPPLRNNAMLYHSYACFIPNEDNEAYIFKSRFADYDISFSSCPIAIIMLIGHDENKINLEFGY